MIQLIFGLLEEVNLFVFLECGLISPKNAISLSIKLVMRFSICVNLSYVKRLQINNYSTFTIWSFFLESNTVHNLPTFPNKIVIILSSHFGNYSNKNFEWQLVCLMLFSKILLFIDLETYMKYRNNQRSRILQFKSMIDRL